MQTIQTDIDSCRREYKKQKQLEKIVSERPLNRPKTKKWHVILLYSAVPVLILCSALCFILSPIDLAYKLSGIILSILLIIELYLRFCFIQTVKCYQHYAKEETRRRCMCVPSCSEYAIICLCKVFPLLFSLIKIRIRLYQTCKGEEYILDFPFKKMNVDFEKKYLQ